MPPSRLHPIASLCNEKAVITSSREGASALCLCQVREARGASCGQSAVAVPAPVTTRRRIVSTPSSRLLIPSCRDCGSSPRLLASCRDNPATRTGLVPVQRLTHHPTSAKRRSAAAQQCLFSACSKASRDLKAIHADSSRTRLIRAESGDRSVSPRRTALQTDRTTTNSVDPSLEDRHSSDRPPLTTRVSRRRAQTLHMLGTLPDEEVTGKGRDGRCARRTATSRRRARRERIP
jgi:hypothetical protein